MQDDVAFSVPSDGLVAFSPVQVLRFSHIKYFKGHWSWYMGFLGREVCESIATRFSLPCNIISSMDHMGHRILSVVIPQGLNHGLGTLLLAAHSARLPWHILYVSKIYCVLEIETVGGGCSCLLIIRRFRFH